MFQFETRQRTHFVIIVDNRQSSIELERVALTAVGFELRFRKFG